MAGTPEPIAIVGVGCKFPGADDPEQLWRVIRNGENHVTEVPPDRFNKDAFYDTDERATGKAYVRRAGFLKDPLAFDNKLYNISDPEADQMDPQQRMALDCSYRALEDAGLTRERIKGSNTGVYVGSMTTDYRGTFNARTDLVGNYTATGFSSNIISNRVSYVYDLRGPSVTVDTACSAALFAVDMAVKSLRSGDCDLAFCGGVNFMLSPDVFVHLSKAKMLSPDGQSYAFSEKANGYGRGEGCGIIILQKLSDALSEGNKVWAVVDTASNQDGRTKSPMPAPSGQQQKELLETVYKKAGVNPDTVHYIEAHGTGTKMGDPIEARAVGEFFKQSGTSRRRYIGSIKSNIGHLESAAGIAGLIKVILMMKYSTIPRTLFADTPRKEIDFGKLNLIVTKEEVHWTESNKTACVNSFGFGGTNCHAILQSRGAMETNHKKKTDEAVPCIVCFSGKNKDSLSGTISDFATHPEVNTLDIHDVSYTSTVCREHYNSRKAFVVSSIDELAIRLNDHLVKKTNLPKPKGKSQIVFVFCGMSTEWIGMCKEMMEISTPFLDIIKEIDACISEYDSTLSIENSFQNEADISEASVAPIAIFACQIALSKLWESVGVTPTYVVGQSVGEIAAACICGQLSLRDAVKIIYFRTKCLAKVTGGKMMLVRNLNVDDVREVLQKFSEKATIALEYSHTSCAVSGDADAISEIKSALQSRATEMNTAVVFKELNVPIAYHSHHVDPCMKELEEALTDLNEGCEPKRTIKMFSTVTGGIVDSDLGSDHWVNNMREPVLFYQAIKAVGNSVSNPIYIELGPKPVLKAHIHDIFPEKEISVIPSMSKKTRMVYFFDINCKVI